ncbi:D-glycero-beta-D-manno-heptose 1-phosphate adenylyltransferase [Sunxiuqinia dokdonensis]|uniref:D-glycero-beta-D-manno-heptose 1-phosphate adenylyltransferase n=1 Tax=Sunxiuqinia dokdonensis TaxID=1409788 RepID=A0A0L8V4E3_9BACT|nr:D-glycero-beta-D-manno-heptose 1-phosphate adenylyltransferase [Sunxiuqinia dokdonensis]KOH43294.1 RfaE bifunctional protein, domain II [Sunxiuqinia dokdonensis]
MNDISAKIYPSFEAFFEKLKTWKTSNYKLVFTNGCFDLLHRGHVDSLTKAARLGDKLIVGLNTDPSVSLLKGANRPIMDEQSRALLIAAMQMVDAVVMFNDETPYNLIKAIQPNVLVKGSEYTIEEIAGHDLVLARGGSVETIEMTKGISTSALIEKIKNL